jgi:hypothetical protein
MILDGMGHRTLDSFVVHAKSLNALDMKEEVHSQKKQVESGKIQW